VSIRSKAYFLWVGGWEYWTDQASKLTAVFKNN
jgi:hypothetical protein